jgi:hypothetical protein
MKAMLPVARALMRPLTYVKDNKKNRPQYEFAMLQGR